MIFYVALPYPPCLSMLSSNLLNVSHYCFDLHSSTLVTVYIKQTRDGALNASSLFRSSILEISSCVSFDCGHLTNPSTYCSGYNFVPDFS